MSSELEDLVRDRATEHRGLRPIPLTVTEHERPCTTVVSAHWVDGQLVVPLDAAAPPPISSSARSPPCCGWPPPEAGDLVELQSLVGDVIGDQILMTPLAAWYQPRPELIFAG